jgi:hypothetical protein
MTSAQGRRPIRVDLDLVPDAEPIRGQVSGADGLTQPFSGWLELIQLLEKARMSGSPEMSAVQEGEN